MCKKCNNAQRKPHSLKQMAREVTDPASIVMVKADIEELELKIVELRRDHEATKKSLSAGAYAVCTRLQFMTKRLTWISARAWAAAARP
jgi:hypothetical protein